MKCLELFRRMEDTQEGTGDFVVGAAQLVIGSSNL
jgi:N-dimethylarginine dimethylaminohydrolase